MFQFLIDFLENGFGLTLEKLACLVMIFWGLIFPILKFCVFKLIKKYKNKGDKI